MLAVVAALIWSLWSLKEDPGTPAAGRGSCTLRTNQFWRSGVLASHLIVNQTGLLLVSRARRYSLRNILYCTITEKRVWLLPSVHFETSVGIGLEGLLPELCKLSVLGFIRAKIVIWRIWMVISSRSCDCPQGPTPVCNYSINKRALREWLLSIVTMWATYVVRLVVMGYQTPFSRVQLTWVSKTGFDPVSTRLWFKCTLFVCLKMM